MDNGEGIKVSIMMCAYNAAPFIERAIKSILSQTYTNWELIICEDGSTDGTLSIINKFTSDKRIKLFVQPGNTGYIRAKNTAFSMATGDLLTQLDADDVYAHEKIEKQVSIFVIHPDVKICGVNFRTIDLADNVLVDNKYKKDFSITEIQEQYPFWFPGLMCTKSIAEEFGPFSEYFNGIYGDDYYWTLRVNKKYPIYFIKDALYDYRIHPDSLTNFYNENNRKLIAENILVELYRQRKTTGTDDLETGGVEKMKQFEQKLFDNKVLMAEKYRGWAAKALDGGYREQAKKLLNKSFRLNKTNLNYYRTYLYYLRTKPCKNIS